jgi:hypothetical protein
MSTTCGGCAAGRFAQKGSQLCLDCPSTAFTALNLSSNCIPCWDFSGANPSKTWCQCMVGNYEMPNPLAFTFFNTTSAAVASRRTSPTSPFMIDGRFQFPSCTKCPVGADCSQPGMRVGTVEPLPGYWPELRGTNTMFIKCMSGNCVGGSKVCADNYTGNLCTECPEGFGRVNDFDCGKCPPPNANKARMAGGFILQIFLNAWLIYSTVNAEKAPTHSVLIKIMTSCAQFNSLALNFQFKFPSFVTGIFTSQQAVSQVGESFTSFDCLFGNDSIPPPVYIKLLMYLMIVPLCVGLPYIVLTCLRERKKRRECHSMSSL